MQKQKRTVLAILHLIGIKGGLSAEVGWWWLLLGLLQLHCYLA